MTLAIALTVTAVLGMILGAVLVYLLTDEERKYLRAELKAAHAQIAHAVIHEQAQIPARTEEVEPVKPLPSELQAVVDDWDEPESRAVEEAKIRSYLAGGHGIPSILRQYGRKE